jgi:hypothetical protein
MTPWRRALLGGGGVWLASRIFITGIALLAHAATHSRHTDFFRLLFHWDSNYLRAIALHGYFSPHSDPTSWVAFFPGYPALSRAVDAALEPAGPTPATLAVAMWIVTLVASLAAAVLVWRLAEVTVDSGPAGSTRGVWVAAGATALVLAGPYALFLAASYGEALFLALAVGAWLCATRKHWLWAGLLAAGASFVRPNGLFLAAAIVVMYLVSVRGERFRLRSLLATLIGFAGTALYFAYLFANTGSLLVWSRAEATWGRALEWPWITFYQTAGRVLYASSFDRRIQFGFDLVFAAIVIVAIILFVRRRRWTEVTYLGLTALSLMTSYSYLSLARNTSVLFPIAFLVAGTLEKPGRRRVFWIVFALGLAILAFNTFQFALGRWAD